MPDVVVIIEVEQLALSVESPGGCRRQDPGGGLVEEEVHGTGPGEAGEDDVDQGLLGDPLPVPQLHEDVEHCIQHQVDDQDSKQKTSKIKPLICKLHNL